MREACFGAVRASESESEDPVAPSALACEAEQADRSRISLATPARRLSVCPDTVAERSPLSFAHGHLMNQTFEKIGAPAAGANPAGGLQPVSGGRCVEGIVPSCWEVDSNTLNQTEPTPSRPLSAVPRLGSNPHTQRAHMRPLCVDGRGGCQLGTIRASPARPDNHGKGGKHSPASRAGHQGRHRHESPITGIMCGF